MAYQTIIEVVTTSGSYTIGMARQNLRQLLIDSVEQAITTIGGQTLVELTIYTTEKPE